MLERIKYLCNKKGISIQKLEKELGWGNGSIAKNGYLRSDRLQTIANYFCVSMEYLMGSDDYVFNRENNTWDIEDNYYLNDETKDMAQFYFDNPDYRVLFDASRKVKPEDLTKALKAIGLFIDEEN